jgi:tryptophanyl-tRNA synthetase
MSKSLGTTIELADSPEEIEQKMKTAFTDPQRKRRSDPGRPEVCLIYTYWNKFKPEAAPEIYEGCSTAALGCVDCKKRVAAAVADYLAPLRERRRELETNPQRVDEIIRDGDEKARARAVETMEQVRDSTHVG